MSLIYISSPENKSHSKTSHCIVLDVDLTLACSNDKIDEYYKLGLNDLSKPEFQSIKDRIYTMNLNISNTSIPQNYFL